MKSVVFDARACQKSEQSQLAWQSNEKKLRRCWVSCLMSKRTGKEEANLANEGSFEKIISERHIIGIKINEVRF